MAWKTTWRSLFGIDPRSLAVFRMAVGALLLADLAIRATDLSAMYTDAGMFSRMEICRRVSTIWNWSFHFGSGSWGYQTALFGLAAILALALSVGFETRLAAIGSWLMLISLHHRAPPILSGADILLRMLLFWAMFLPLERVWSLDRWLDERRGRADPRGSERHVLSVASGAILLQMALMYLFSAIFKSNAVWWRGEALAGIMAHDFYASPLGDHLLRFPRLLTAMTWGTLGLEWLGPLLLFSPRWTAGLRLGAVAGLAALHVGIGIFLEVDLFSPVALAGLTLFLPPQFWNSPILAPFSRPFVGVNPLADIHRDKGIAKERLPVFSITQGVCVVLLLYVLAVNISGLPGRPLARLAPDEWKPLKTACGLGQKWNMFEDVPSKDGWYVARAKLKDGSEVDLCRRGAAIDWSRPAFPAGLYPNYRWRKLFREMAYDDEIGFQWFRAPVAAFLCRDWNARQPAEKQIIEFDLIFCMESGPRSVGGSALQTAVRERLVHLDLSESDHENAWTNDP